MHEYGKMDQTIMHCIFVGPAGVGKSSLLKRLLRMKLDQTRTSTPLAKTSVRVDLVRDVSTSVAQMSGFDWQIIKDPMAQASELFGHLSAEPETTSTRENSIVVHSGQTEQVSKQQESSPNLPADDNSNLTTSSAEKLNDSQLASLPAEHTFDSQITNLPSEEPNHSPIINSYAEEAHDNQITKSAAEAHDSQITDSHVEEAHDSQITDSHVEEPKHSQTTDSHVEEPKHSQTTDTHVEEPKHSQTTDSHVEEPKHSQTTDSHVEEPKHSQTTDSHVEEPKHSQKTDSHVEEPKHSQTTDSHVEEPKHSQTTDSQVEEPKHSQITDTHVEEPKHSQMTDSHLEEPKHSQITDTHVEEPKHSQMTDSHVEEPKHSQMTDSHVEEPKHSQMIDSHVEEPKHSQMTDSHVEEPKHSQMTDSHVEEPKHSQMTDTHVEEPKHSQMTDSHVEEPKHTQMTDSHVEEPKHSQMTDSHVEEPKHSQMTDSHAEEAHDSQITDSHVEEAKHNQILIHTEEPHVSQITTSPAEVYDSQIINSKDSLSTASKSPDYETSQFSNTIEFFRHVLKERGVSRVRVENPCTLYLTDSGGQPEFQELLPALVVGPCVFFIVFPLHKDLNAKYLVEYVRPDNHMKKYISSLTIKEDLMRSLASIACTKYKDIYGNEVNPRVMFVATFKDKVSEEHCLRVLKELQDLVKVTDAFHQGMIVDASETQTVFTINNASDEEAEKDAKKIRDAFQKITASFKVCTPSPWLIFCILVQHIYGKERDMQYDPGKDSVISYDECFKLAQECGIKSPDMFEAALQFLHKQTGVLHYYKEEELPELSQIVIRDPQHLFNRVNQLIERTFIFEKTQSSKPSEDFKKGIFKKADYEKLTEEFSSSKLTPIMLLKLLEHLNVVVPLGDGEKYFMPCAISHLTDDSSSHTTDKASSTCCTQSPTIPPLLITFKSGYCPKGLFGTLVVCITNKQIGNCTLSLDESSIHRDQISFTLGLHRLLLRINPTYIYIEVIPPQDNSLSIDLCNLCNDVRNFIEDNITEACMTLRYSNSANCGLSFICQCSEEDTHHPAELRHDPVNGHCFLCTRSKKEALVNTDCHVWLPEVRRKL